MKLVRYLYTFFTLMFFLVLKSAPTFSAAFTLEITDRAGKPQVNAVAALVPATKTNYTQKAKGIMDQRNNAFVPGVLAVRVNTLVYFPNGDDVRHQVYSFSPAKRFELRLYHGLTAEPVLFDQPGQVILGCNIHDSMLGYIYVLDTEYFGVSDSAGNLTIDNIPAGTYTLQLQHPKQAGSVPDRKIQIAEEQAIKQKVTLDIAIVQINENPGTLNSLFK